MQPNSLSLGKRQQMLGRSIARDLIASVFQTTFYGRSERSIVINDMNNSRQGEAPHALLITYPKLYLTRFGREK
jgi:hypothetical protein